MEQAPRHYCRNCNTWKSKDQFNLRQKDDRFGSKGEPTSVCMSCTTKNRQTRQEKKRKHDEDHAHPSEDPAEAAPIRSIDQFTEQLRQQALEGDICCRMRVSTQGLAAEDDTILKIIAAHVWEATGFRFTFVWLLLAVQ